MRESPTSEVPALATGRAMIVKRSISIRGHSTSISIEDEFWRELRAIAARLDRPLAGLIAAIDTERPADRNLSSAIRVFVLAETLERAGPGEAPSGDTSPSSGPDGTSA